MKTEKSAQFQQAAAYARDRLENELSEDLTYHGAHHTRDDVVPATQRLAKAHELSEKDTRLLLTAAWYHDIGYIEQYEDNEPIGARMAQEALTRFGYNNTEIAAIVEIILATRLPHNPKTLLQSIMVDADLDSLGRDDFIHIAKTLRDEEAIYINREFNNVAWYEFEMNFLRSHRYFTSVQRYYRTPGKLQNFMRLYRLRQKALSSKS